MMGSRQSAEQKAEATRAQLERMQLDPDMQAEADSLRAPAGQPHAQAEGAEPPEEPEGVVLFMPGRGSHVASEHTRRLLRQAGGLPALLPFTEAFYQKAFHDPHVDKFIREHSDPHGERFAQWVAEKFGEGQPWTEARLTRKPCTFLAHGQTFKTAHDRSSAHHAAWHSPKREGKKFGSHFDLRDARIWMRLHFWALRESGLCEKAPGFVDYYVKFIGHFVSIYESTAPCFVREAFRWSADAAKIKRYLSLDRQMPDVFVPYREALLQLPAEEREDQGWPYGR